MSAAPQYDWESVDPPGGPAGAQPSASPSTTRPDTSAGEISAEESQKDEFKSNRPHTAAQRRSPHRSQNYPTQRPQAPQGRGPRLPPLDPGHSFLSAYSETSDYPRFVKAVQGDQTGYEVFDASSMLYLPPNITPEKGWLLDFCRDYGWPAEGMRLMLCWGDDVPGDEGGLIAMGSVRGMRPMYGPGAAQPHTDHFHSTQPYSAQPYPEQPYPGQPHTGHAHPGHPAAQPHAPNQTGHATGEQAPSEPETSSQMNMMMEMMVGLMATVGHQEETIWTRIKEFRINIEDLETLKKNGVFVKQIIEGGMDWLFPLVARKWMRAWEKEKGHQETLKTRRAKQKQAKQTRQKRGTS